MRRLPVTRKFLLWIAVAIVLASLVALPKILRGGEAGRPSGGRGATGSAQGKAGAGGPANFKVRVTAHVVKPTPTAERIVSTGTLIAGDQVLLKSEASGRVVALPMREGARVRQGQLLVKINDADLQAQLIKAHAALVLADSMAAREKTLLDRTLVSQQEYEQARQSLESARGDEALIRAQIARTEIRAPFAGVVGLKQVSLGDYLSPGSPVADLVSDIPLKIDFSVPEQYYDSISPGKAVSFTVQGSPRAHAAHVYAVDPAVNENTRTVRVRAVCDSGDSNLAPGAFAQLSLVLREKPQALMVPSQAIVPVGNGQQVYALRQGKAAPEPVRTGLRTDSTVEIVNGVRPGDTIITTGVILLRPGAPVEVAAVD